MNIHNLSDPIIQSDFENVYAPAEDSYLIIDYFKRAINLEYFDEIELNEIENILDLGTGTGIIAIFLQLVKIHNPNFNPEIYGSDILEDSIKCVRLNEARNKISEQIKLIHSNLFTSFPEDLKHSFNIIIFNPPYLPSSPLIKKNRNKQDIDYSWDGGIKGYEIIIDFINSAKNFLNLEKPHSIYFITSSRTNLKELNNKIINLGYVNKIVDKRHIFFEDIFLNRLRLK